jgi:hypothetical protein
MQDDPYGQPSYAHPAPVRAGILPTADLPHAFGPVRLYAQRLLLLILALYTVLALLFVVSSHSFAAPLDAAAASADTHSLNVHAAD